MIPREAKMNSNTLRNIIICTATTLFFSHGLFAGNPVNNEQTNHDKFDSTQLNNYKWAHGKASCETEYYEAFDTFSLTATTHIFRQSKCKTFEAPFLFLLQGEDSALLIDTGAVEKERDFSLADMLSPYLSLENGGSTLVVAHSHSHSDHINGDSQLKGRVGVTIVEPSKKELLNYFNLINWPTRNAHFNLGNRQIVVIPAPGHHPEAIALYDTQTHILFTGDTLYPGQVYVRNWDDYRETIKRLADFTNEYKVIAILGSHIEMSKGDSGLYPIGTIYQPNEASLVLFPEDLRDLAMRISEQKNAKEMHFDKFVITPMSFLQKTLSNIVKFFH